MIDILTSFIIGVFIGAGGKYIADKHTDRRREQESRKKQKKKFKEIKSKMPELINEMRKDLKEKHLIREFVILKKTWGFNTTKGYFYYYYDEHDQLDNKVDILENAGYIQDVADGNAKKYRMSEEFVKLIKDS